MEFAKIFKVGKKHQVLVTEILPAEGEELYGINIETRIDGLSIATKLEHKTENDAESAFEKFDQSYADAFFDQMNNLLTRENE